MKTLTKKKNKIKRKKDEILLTTQHTMLETRKWKKIIIYSKGKGKNRYICVFREGKTKR